MQGIDEPGHERQAKLDDIEQRCRLAFLAGAEEESLRSLARHLTKEEQERVVRRYRGGWPSEEETC
jgi:hypothetical protein